MQVSHKIITIFVVVWKHLQARQISMRFFFVTEEYCGSFKTQNLSQFRNKKPKRAPDFLLHLFAMSVQMLYRRKLILSMNESNTFIVCHHKLSFNVRMILFFCQDHYDVLQMCNTAFNFEI